MNAVWLLTESNDKAHSLSRKSDCDDWEIEDIIFKYLDNFFPSSGVPVQQVSTHLGLHGNALIIG